MVAVVQRVQDKWSDVVAQVGSFCAEVFAGQATICARLLFFAELAGGTADFVSFTVPGVGAFELLFAAVAEFRRVVSELWEEG